jgi:ATP-dependent Clp protease ATP-binding subunit ClpA
VLDGICRRRLRAVGIAAELVGRISSFLVFGSLTPHSRAEVITLSVYRVAEEYGLPLKTIAPGVVASILAAYSEEGFGVRPDEYLIDNMLGACFADAARDNAGGPFMLDGPPYRCTPSKDE